MAERRASDGRGTLVVVAGPDARGKEMVVAAIKRRFACRPGIEFPPRVMTRPHREGCDWLSVSRRAFREMEREGAFALSWQAQGYDAAAPAAILDSLAAGHLLVLVATLEAARQARDLGAAVRTVELLAGPDGSRPMCGAALARRAEGPSCGSEHRVWHGGDIAEAVRRLSALVESLAALPVIPPPALPVLDTAPVVRCRAAQRKRAPLVWRSPESWV